MEQCRRIPDGFHRLSLCGFRFVLLCRTPVLCFLDQESQSGPSWLGSRRRAPEDTEDCERELQGKNRRAPRANHVHCMTSAAFICTDFMGTSRRRVKTVAMTCDLIRTDLIVRNCLKADPFNRRAELLPDEELLCCQPDLPRISRPAWLPLCSAPLPHSGPVLLGPGKPVWTKLAC